jgi:hypothetical protein
MKTDPLLPPDFPLVLFSPCGLLRSLVANSSFWSRLQYNSGALRRQSVPSVPSVVKSFSPPPLSSLCSFAANPLQFPRAAQSSRSFFEYSAYFASAYFAVKKPGVQLWRLFAASASF